MNVLTRARLTFCSGETLATMMQSLADVHGNRRVATDAEGRSLTYRQAAKRVARWAGGIAAATEPGDRVVIQTPNTYELFLLVLADGPGRMHRGADQPADAPGRGQPTWSGTRARRSWSAASTRSTGPSR